MTRGPALPDERRDLTARYAALDEAAAFVSAFCARRAIGRPVELRLALVLEELITNTIEHGFGGESDAAVGVALRASDAGIELLYEDAAPPFDPLAHAARSPAAVDAALDERPIGGLGIHLLGRLASAARYAREGGRNRLWLTLSTAPDSSAV
jgi:serine/threonine-protein kinase RsbW